MTRKIHRRQDGYMLVEYIIYIALLAVVMSLAFGAFYRFFDHSRDLTRNSEDILRTLRAGELWRADIREALAPPTIRTEEGLTACEIVKTNSHVAYIFAEGALWRKVDDAPPKAMLPRVRASTMLAEDRHGVTSWRWEVELQTRKKVVRVRPLFTFRAVPSHLSR